jgi:hypothetical protein
VARSAGALDPLERVKLELGPVPVPAPPQAAPVEPPAAPDPPLVVALRRFLKEHPEKARRLLEKSCQTNQEVMLAVWELLDIDEREARELSPDEVAVIQARLRVLAQRLNQRAGLTLGEVCFCRRIDSFGQYERLPRSRQGHYEFQAGSDGLPGERIQIYAEVRNFTSVRHNDHFETRLTSELEIHDNSLGIRDRAPRLPPVYMKLGTCSDVSQTRRHDYFLNFQFHVPPRLPPGLYTLRVTIKDEQSATPGQKPRQVTGSLDFRVRPPGPR